MIAVIELGGNQFIVREWDIIDVKKQDEELESIFNIEALLIASEDGKELKVWTPTVSGSKIELKVIDQFKGEKIRIFKMKSKKRFARNNGFRPKLTKVQVVSIA